MSHATSQSGRNPSPLLGAADLLSRYPVFRARDLELAREYLSGVLAPHGLTYLARERRLDFRHRAANLSAIELNALQYGANVRISAPPLPEHYLLEFQLAGSNMLTQGGRTLDMPTGSVAIINPRRPFTKSASPDSRKLMIRIERSLL